MSAQARRSSSVATVAGFIPLAAALTAMACEVALTFPYFEPAGVVGWIALACALVVTGIAVAASCAALGALILGDRRMSTRELPSDRLRRSSLPPAAVVCRPLAPPPARAREGGEPLEPVASAWPTWPTEEELALTERVARSGNPVNPARHDQPRSWTPYGIRFWPLLLTFAVGTVVTLIVEFSQNPPKIL
jgi:hypothetical protein